MKLNTIVKFLNREIQINRIKDSSRNGLQVRSNSEIKKVGFAVDGCLSTFEKAKKAKIDLLIVHHGIKWKPQKYKLVNQIRETFLRENKISLYTAHLPLDASKKYGNNYELARLLELKHIREFGNHDGDKIGSKGRLNFKAKKIALVMDRTLKTKTQLYLFGKKQIKSIGIVSGSGGSTIEDAVKEKLDALIIGEAKESDYNRAKDFKLNLIVAGHYATETVGVKALQKLIKEKFKLKTEFIDNPVPI